MAAIFPPPLGPTDALLVMDIQRDFFAGGALPVLGGDQVVAVLNTWVDEAARARALVVCSRDWHPREHASFMSRGGPWPEHCVQGSRGAELHPSLELSKNALLLWKGQDRYRDAASAFDGTGLASVLEERGIRRIFLGGLAHAVCLRASVLDAERHGFAAHVLVNGTRPVEARPVGTASMSVGSMKVPSNPETGLR